MTCFVSFTTHTYTIASILLTDTDCLWDRPFVIQVLNQTSRDLSLPKIHSYWGVLAIANWIWECKSTSICFSRRWHSFFNQKVSFRSSYIAGIVTFWQLKWIQAAIQDFHGRNLIPKASATSASTSISLFHTFKNISIFLWCPYTLPVSEMLIYLLP